MNVTRGVVLALLVGVAFTLAGCSIDVSGPGTPSAGAYGINETATLTQENTTMAVTITDYRLVDTPERSGDGGTVTPPAGRQLLYVHVTVENTGSNDSATPAVGVRPTSSEAPPAALPAWASDGEYVAVQHLAAGQTRTGWVSRVVPANTTAGDVRIAFSPDILITDDEYDWRLD